MDFAPQPFDPRVVGGQQPTNLTNLKRCLVGEYSSDEGHSNLFVKVFSASRLLN